MRFFEYYGTYLALCLREKVSLKVLWKWVLPRYAAFRHWTMLQPQFLPTALLVLRRQACLLWEKAHLPLPTFRYQLREHLYTKSADQYSCGETREMGTLHLIEVSHWCPTLNKHSVPWPGWASGLGTSNASGCLVRIDQLACPERRTT